MADMMDTATDLSESLLEGAMEKIRRRESMNAKLASKISQDAGITRECDDCGADIPRARLLAVPTTHRCASCQEDVERQRR